MTTEDDLQCEIDRNPAEVALRGLIADLIGETGDPREMGYRALSRLGRRPCLRGAQPGYHDGKGLTSWKAEEIHTRNLWALKQYNLVQKEYAIRRTAPFHVPRRRDRYGQAWIELLADPIHSLPRVWFNACWGEWWKNDEEALPWIMLKTRRELDDFVAKAFLNTPKPFQDHVLNCPLPVEFPFWFNCPRCGGSGRMIIADPINYPPMWKSAEETLMHHTLFATTTHDCEWCKGRGKFREDYGDE